jgi:hypothetical protein
MPEATIEHPSGAKVTVSGSEDEIKRILAALVPGSSARKFTRRVKKGRVSSSSAGSAIRDYVLELRQSGQFNKAKGLTEVKDALAAEGRIIPITTLSGVMLSLAKSKELRRFKEDGTWKYVKR